MREATEMGREEFTCQATQAKCSKVESLISQRDRLTAENEKLSTKVATLQSQLDKIGEPIKRGRYEGGSGWTESNATWRLICDYLDSQKPSEKPNPKPHTHTSPTGITGEPPKCEHKNLGELLHDGQRPQKRWCKDCISWIDLTPKCEHKNLGPLALGGTQRCLDCHEWIIAKPFTLCPECHNTKYINRVVSVTDWEWHRYYMIVDCLNCSGAKG